jgi:hypothetical protein
MNPHHESSTRRRDVLAMLMAGGIAPLAGFAQAQVHLGIEVDDALEISEQTEI